MVTTVLGESRASGGSLLRALEGLGNRRAIALLLGSAASSMVMIAIGSAAGGGLVLVGLSIVAVLFLLVGFCAAGGVLMDVTRGVPARSVPDAIVIGAGDFFRLIGIFILTALSVAAYLVLLAGVLYVCKIPGVGPVLYALVFPIASISSAILIVGVSLFFQIAPPAVWEGNSVGATFARITSVASKRLPEVIVRVVLLNLLMVAVGAILWSFFLWGTSMVGGLSALILGADVQNPFAGAMAGFGFGGRQGFGLRSVGDGYAYAVIFGGGLLAAIAVAAYLSVLAMGLNLVYLQVSAGLDAGAIEKSLAASFEQARHKASELQDRARQRMQEAQERAHRAAAERAAMADALRALPDQQTLALGTARCPSCNAPVTPDQAFCGECGHRLA